MAAPRARVSVCYDAGMRVYVIVGALCLVAAGLAVWLWPTSASYEITNAPPKGDTIVAIGDSLIEGVGAQQGGDLPAQLTRRLGTPVINEGISGDTTKDALARIDKILSHEPDIVIVLLGGNDFLRDVPLDETFGNLHTIITRLQEEGAVVVLLGVRGGRFGDPAAGRFEQLARVTGSVYVPDVLEGLIGDSRFMADPIHPNTAGYAVIADRVAPVVHDLMVEP